MDNVVWNKCQTPLEELAYTDPVEGKIYKFNECPQEVQEQFWDFLNNVPFINWLVSANRPLVPQFPRMNLEELLLM